MKTIALIAQKGGVGKTTLAVNLAVASGLRTTIFDLDPQESAAIWTDRRKIELPRVEFLTERRLKKDSRQRSAVLGRRPRHRRRGGSQRSTNCPTRA